MKLNQQTDNPKLVSTTITLLVLLLLIATPRSLLAKTEIRFEKKKISIQGKIITVELADNEEKSQLGLMYRTKLNENEGMLFVFDDESVKNFWMKNTFIPLSIGFFDKNKTLVDVQDMEPVKSELQTNIPSYESKKPAKYALEVTRGWYKKHKIKLGSKFSFSN